MQLTDVDRDPFQSFAGSVISDEKCQRWVIFAAIVVAGVLSLLVGILGSAAADYSVSVASFPWDSPQHMSTTSSKGAFIPVIRADKTGRLVLMYNHVKGSGVANPYYRQSTDGGLTWSAPTAVYNSPTSSFQVAFALDSSDVAHAAWRTQTEIWYAGESQWPNNAILVSSPGQLVFSPDIAVSGDNTLHAVWTQQDNRAYHAFSVNGGANWTVSPALTQGTSKSDVPAVAVDLNNKVHAVWEERIWDGAKFLYEIQYKKGSLSGSVVNWDSTATKLSGTVSEARMPSIHAEGNTIHVAFARRDSDDEQYAYYVRFTPGSGWSTPLEVTQADPVTMNTNIPFVLAPTLDVCGGAVHIYFHGAIAANHKERIMAVSSDDGWSGRVHVTNGQTRAIRPSLICVKGILHVAFEEIVQPNIDHQVYYTADLANTHYLPFVTRR